MAIRKPKSGAAASPREIRRALDAVAAPLPAVSVLGLKLLGLMLERDQLREENARLTYKVAALREMCRRRLCQGEKKE